MKKEVQVVWEYLKAVGRYWWIIVVGLGLTIMDFVERIFATWFQPPSWARIATAITGFTIAQYLAYRRLRLAIAGEADQQAKAEKLATALKAGRGLQWEAKYKSGTTSQEFSNWASNLDDWIRQTHALLLTELGPLAAEMFLNDAGMKDISYPGIPSEYHERLSFLNRRLENLHRASQTLMGGRSLVVAADFNST